MKKIVSSILVLLILISCSQKQPDKVDYLEIYKLAFKTIFEMDSDVFNNNLKYMVIELDNLSLLPEDKEKLISYMADLSGVEVSEGDYSVIEGNLINRKHGGMAIGLGKQKIISDRKIEIQSIKLFLSGIELTQTLEKRNDTWTLTEKRQIRRSK
ncbi:hypothetical protein [Paenibacillus sp. KN14-4R]|uniref:hypothetical protein n=1 Tax=Paenibacillus sp. KN14-4R TaxID=3445773 RepID=UPI003FA11A66